LLVSACFHARCEIYHLATSLAPLTPYAPPYTHYTPALHPLHPALHPPITPRLMHPLPLTPVRAPQAVTPYHFLRPYDAAYEATVSSQVLKFPILLRPKYYYSALKNIQCERYAHTAEGLLAYSNKNPVVKQRPIIFRFQVSLSHNIRVFTQCINPKAIMRPMR